MKGTVELPRRNNKNSIFGYYIDIYYLKRGIQEIWQVSINISLPQFAFLWEKLFYWWRRIEKLSSVIFWILILATDHSVHIVYEKRKSFLVHTKSEVNRKDVNTSYCVTWLTCTSDAAWKVSVFGVFLIRIFLHLD